MRTWPLLLASACALGALRVPREAHGEEPWNARRPDAETAEGRAALSAASVAPIDRDGSLLGAFFDSCIRFYQRHLSRLRPAGCRMEPSCSRYAAQCIERHGAFVGSVMAVDRLIHEPDEKRVAREAGGRFLDPPENNDFWWFSR